MSQQEAQQLTPIAGAFLRKYLTEARLALGDPTQDIFARERLSIHPEILSRWFSGSRRPENLLHVAKCVCFENGPLPPEKAGEFCLSFAKLQRYENGEIDVDELPDLAREFLQRHAPDNISDLVRPASSSFRSDENVQVENVTIAERTRLNRVSIVYTIVLILNEVEDYREKVRTSNSVSEDVRAKIFGIIDEISKSSNELLEYLANVGVDVDRDKTNKINLWLERFGASLKKNLKILADPENIAGATVPTSIILGCGALGALVGGPVGFGAGSVVGHLITGQMKPGVAAKKVEDVLVDAPDNKN